MRRARDERRCSYADVILDAVDAAWDDLEELAPPAPGRRSPLPRRTRHHRTNVGPTRQVHLLLTSAERRVLEEVVDTTTVGSLTDLVERVLRHHLGVAPGGM